MAFMSELGRRSWRATSRAFEWHGGDFDVLRYDNLKSAGVRACSRAPGGSSLTGSWRWFGTARFELVHVSRRPAEGLMRREAWREISAASAHRHLVPVPEVSSIEELNELLEEACWADLDRTITGQTETVGQRRDRERCCWARCPAAASDLGGGDPEGRQQGAGDRAPNRYSVPAVLRGLKIRAQIGAGEISFWPRRQAGRPSRTAARPASDQRQLDHYLDLLARSPERSPVAGAAPGARPR